MKKIFVFIVVALFLFLSCEKDDICDNSTATTSRLVVQFYDVNNRAVVKNATNLKVTGEGALTPIVFNASATDELKFLTSASTISIPLRTNSDQTKYIFTLNADPGGTPSSDTIVFNYGRNNEYVSRACGFKTVFDFSNRPAGTNAFTLNGNSTPPFGSPAWIRDVEIIKTNINNEKETHVKIYF
ncbi:MAG TPA: DUF6452 family protein [Flavobacterium sp.]|jgi:hypothetical protein